MKEKRITVVSYERTTGRGARHETQVMSDANAFWAPVSIYADSHHVGRAEGFEVYTLELLPGDSFRAYHCSNTGIENVVADRIAGPDDSSITLEEGEAATRVAFPHKF